MADSKNYIYDLKAKRKHRKRFTFFSLLGVTSTLFLTGVVWFFVRAPFFRVHTISFNGGSKVSKDETLTFIQAHVFPRSLTASLFGADNIFIWPSSVASSDLAFLPMAKEVIIKKEYLSRSIAISVTERKPYGIWCMHQGEEVCFWFDEDGVLYKKSVGVDGGTLIRMVDDYTGRLLKFGDQVLSGDSLQNFFTVMAAINASGINHQEIKINDLNLQQVEVVTYNGPRVFFSLRFPADQTVPVLQSFKNRSDFKNMSLVDFRVLNRVYYK